MVAIAKEIQLAEPKPKRKISWEEFQRKYLTREDKYKYEWVDGYVEKTLRWSATEARPKSKKAQNISKMGSESSTLTFVAQPPAKKISWKEFQHEYLTREDDFKYEWVDGMVEKTPRTMEKRQLFVFDVLDDLLEKLQYAEGRNISGKLIPEPDIFFAGKHRRPDIAFFTKEQIKAAKRDEDVVPQFVIEIISKNDQIILVEEKMENYLAAEVPIVWQIIPARRMVKEIRGKVTKNLYGDDICSAEPVIEGFRISVNDIFK